MKDVAAKWGSPVAERGFAQIPNALIRINQVVDDEHQVSPLEMVLLLQLVATWWKTDEMPFPSISTLADRAGVSERQVQRSIKTLEQKGYVRRTKKSLKGIIASNVYDLMPLVKILNDIAETLVNRHPRKIKVPDRKGREKRSNAQPVQQPVIDDDR